MKLATLTVHAGWHRRRWCPVTAQVQLDADEDLGSLMLRDVSTDTPLAVQAWREEDGAVSLAWIVADLPAHQILIKMSNEIGIFYRYIKRGLMEVFKWLLIR